MATLKKSLMLLALLLVLAGPARGQLPDFAFNPSPYWEFVVIPLDNINTTPLYFLPPALPGDLENTYWNISYQNAGTGDAGFYQVILQVDDILAIVYSLYELAAGATETVINLGPHLVRGGRHTAWVNLDCTYRYAESDETNNIFGHQFYWAPPFMAVNTSDSKPAPPRRDAGWTTITDGSVFDFSFDAMRINNSSWWTAVVMKPDSASADYDLDLFNANDNPQPGLLATQATSARGAGLADAVIVNRNTMGSADWDVGISLYQAQGNPNYLIEHVGSQPYNAGTSLLDSLKSMGLLNIYDTYVDAQHTGPMTVRVETDNTAIPLYVAVYDQSFTVGGLDGYLASATTDYHGHTHFTVNFPVSGYYGIAVWREEEPTIQGLPAQDYTLTVEAPLPDLTPFAPSGWAYPVVPRPQADGTPTLVAAPDTLHGFQPATYFNWATLNASDVAGGVGVGQVNIMVDDQYTVIDPVSTGWNGGQIITNNGITGNEVRGGRHTVAVIADFPGWINEDNETNNVWSRQFCWSPMVLTGSAMVHYNQGPDNLFTYWDPGFSGNPFFINVDGFRIEDPLQQSYWVGAAVVSGPGTDHDLTLFEALAGTEYGFDNGVAHSTYGGDGLDYVVTNFNMTPFRAMDIGVNRYDGSGDYHLQPFRSVAVDGSQGGALGPFNMGSDELIAFFDIYLNPGDWHFRLESVAGAIDWGMTLHDPQMVFQSRVDHFLGGDADAAGPGQDEFMDATLPDTGWYGLAIYKSQGYQRTEAGTFNLYFTQGVADAGQDTGLPAATRLAKACPNPFNPRTDLIYELEQTGPVELAIYDLKGALVKRLASEPMTAGTHHLLWDGRDNRGRSVPSGVYFARLVAADEVSTMKLVLTK